MTLYTTITLLDCHGLEVMCCRSAESFSAADYLAWLNEIHSSYRADLEEKLSAMDSLQYTTISSAHVCAVWEREPVRSYESQCVELNF